MYLNISPYTAYGGSPRFAKPFLTVFICRIPSPHDGNAPATAPKTPQTPTAQGVKGDAASGAPLKRGRIDTRIDERLHGTLYVVVMVMAYMA